MGAPNTTDDMALQPIRNLCIIRPGLRVICFQFVFHILSSSLAFVSSAVAVSFVPATNMSSATGQMAQVMVYYHEVETASLQLCHDDLEVVSSIDRNSRNGVAAMTQSAQALYRYYQGETESCENDTFQEVVSWEELMFEVVNLAKRALEASIEFIHSSRRSNQSNVDVAMLRDSFDRLAMGSASPQVPVQPTEELFEQIINGLQPSVEAFEDAMQFSYTDVPLAVLEANVGGFPAGFLICLTFGMSIKFAGQKNRVTWF